MVSNLRKRVGALAGLIEVKFTASGHLGWTHVREYWTARPLLFSVLFAVAWVSPFLGYFIDGVWPGAIVGFCISMALFFAGFFVLTRHRDEIRSR